MTAHASESGSAYLRPNDICARFDVQPYVLKFWESEFPQLSRRIGPKRLYDGDAIEIVQVLRRLLLDEHLTLGEAREALSDYEPGGKVAPEPAGAMEEPAAATVGRLAELESALGRAEQELVAARELAAEREREARESDAQRESLRQRLAEYEARLAESAAAAPAGATAEEPLAAKVAELQAQLDVAAHAHRQSVDALTAQLDEARQELERGRQDREQHAGKTGRLPAALARVEALERDLVEERHRLAEALAHAETASTLVREAEQREAALRSLVSGEISAALRQVREVAFDAEGLAACLEPDGATSARLHARKPREQAPRPPGLFGQS
ncbi:MAG: MerR family transcriptional regulator [Acidobacteria bacterium]|nr:MerR family transcriptional regulator [Acidobacteriota bacterium]